MRKRGHAGRPHMCDSSRSGVWTGEGRRRSRLTPAVVVPTLLLAAPTLLVAALTLLLAALILLPRVAVAQEENRAGLVIVYGDGHVEQQCVAFAEESISGYDLLQRSDLLLSIEAGAIGPTVCRIGNEGCSYPQESCFCRCQGNPCVYWSYWRLQGNGAWRYQSLGAGNTEVRAGDVEGWRWAEGTTNDAEEPPVVTFAGVCGQPVQQAASFTPAMPAEHVPAAAATPVIPEAGATAAVSPPVALVENMAPATLDAANGTVAVQGGMQPLWFLLAGVIVVPALVLVMWVLVRKGR